MPDLESTYRMAGSDRRHLVQYLLYRRHRFAYEEVSRRLQSGAVVADVGCGFGYALEILLRKARRIYALDAARTALRRLPALPHVRKLLATASDIPLADASVDCVTAFQLIEHLTPDQTAAAFREFVRVLRPGGRVYATTPNARWRLFPGQRPVNPYHHLEYRVEDVERLCRAASHPCEVRSVTGLHGAQEIERARVAPDPVAHFGPGLQQYVAKLWQRYGPPQGAAWRRRGATPVTPGHEATEWFTLSDDPAAGVDFWIEIAKSAPSAPDPAFRAAVDRT